MSRIDEALRRLASKDESDDQRTDIGARPVSEPIYEKSVRLERQPEIRERQPEIRPFVPRHPASEFGAGHTIPAAAAPPKPPAPQEPEDKLIDVSLLADCAGFMFRAIRRRKLVVAIALVLGIGATTAAALLWPKTYHVHAALLAQRNEVMTALSNPGRAISREGDVPTRAAAETVLRRENVISLIKQTNLLQEWDRTRTPLLRAKDWAMKRMRGQIKDEERIDALVGLLEKQLQVAVGTEGTVMFDIDWPNARMGYELVESAVQNFLDARQVAETSAISDSISILERTAASLESDISSTIANIQAEQAARPSVRLALPPIPRAPATAAAALAAVTSSADAVASGAPEYAFRVNRLRASLDAKRQEIARLEEARRQQVTDTQNQLSAALTVYTEANPTVKALRERLATQMRDSQQLTTAKTEEQSLQTEYEAAAAAQAADEQRVLLAGRAAAAADPIGKALKGADKDKDALAPRAVEPLPMPQTEFTSSNAVHLRLQLTQLGEIRDRLQSARIEQATAQAGFKYRYSVTQPPQVPRNPTKPNVPAVIIAGIVATLLLAVFVAVGSDLWSDRLLEPWQMDRLVGVPVLVRLKVQ